MNTEPDEELDEEPEEFEEQEPWYCEMCGGDIISMGGLGNREYGRCRNCGWQEGRDL